jgi:hypothetical protein
LFKQFVRQAAFDLVRVARTRPRRTVFAGVDICAPLAMMAFLPHTKTIDDAAVSTTFTGVELSVRPLVLLDPVLLELHGRKQPTNESHRHCPKQHKSYERYSIVQIRGWNALSLRPAILYLHDDEARLVQHFLSWHHGDSPCHVVEA